MEQEMMGLRPPQQQAAPQQAGPQPTEEERELYKKVVGFAMLALYDKSFMPHAVKIMTSSPDPVKAVAEVTIMVGERLLKTARTQGQEIPTGLILQAGAEILSLVIELGMNRGMQELAPEQAEQALFMAADQFNEIYDADEAQGQQPQAPQPEPQQRGLRA